MSPRQPIVPNSPKAAPVSVGSVAAGLRIVRGVPDDEEIAALIAGMVAVAAARDATDEIASPTSAWMDRSRTMRGRRVGVLGRGDAAWRHSLR